MAADPDGSGGARNNLLERTLEATRQTYVEENGEEPPPEFMERARTAILREFAQHGRDEHRDIYDALADE